MIKGHILPRTGLGKLKDALDAYAMRQRVISENIANLQTPGYTSRKVNFEDNLRNAYQRRLRLSDVPAHPKHLPIGFVSRQPATVVKRGEAYHNGVNDVNLEREMTDLARNSLAFGMVAKVTKGRIESIRSAITGKHR